MSPRILATVVGTATLAYALFAGATPEPSCVSRKGNADLGEKEHEDAQTAFERASRDLERATAAVDDATAGRDAAVNQLAADGGAERAREAATALADAEAKLNLARDKKECLEKDRDAVERSAVYDRAVGIHATGAFGAGDQNRFGGALSYGLRTGVSTEWEVGASASRLVELERPDRQVLIGLPFRIFFGREQLSGTTAAFYVGPNVEMLLRDGDPYVALAGQLGLRLRSSWLVHPGWRWDIRTFVEPRLTEGIDGPAPFSVLFGVQLGLARIWSSRPTLSRWDWKTP